MRCARPLLLLPALLTASAAGAVEYGLGYLAIPGTIEFAQTTLATAAREPQNESASFGTLGLRLILPVGGRLGPFTTAVETGFAVPAGDQAFDHRKLAVYTGSGTPFSHAQRHDGDFSTWGVAVVPLMLLTRIGGPSSGVSFSGEAGAGMLVVGLTAETTETTYDFATDTTIVSREKSSAQAAALAFAMSASAGIIVPASESLDLRLTGGVVWMSNVAWTTKDENASPVLIYGATPASPGLALGGLGFQIRLGLSLNL